MSYRLKLLSALNRLIAPSHAELVDRAELHALRELRGDSNAFLAPSFKSWEPPENASAYLRPTNPRLQEIRRLYKHLNHPAADHSLWAGSYLSDELTWKFFRGDNPYVWQLRRLPQPEAKYALATYYARSIDKLGLFAALNEDGAFGAYTYTIGGTLVSRDLLDSIIEISFLEQQLGLSRVAALNVLDIGAGYGRFAHRLVTALPNVASVLCADAIPESHFLCEYYLRFRGIEQRTKVITLPEIDTTLSAYPVGLAVNMHAFSECTLSSISWWLNTLQSHRIKFLMIVPSPSDHGGTKLLSREQNGEKLDFLPVIGNAGYKLRIRAPKYAADHTVQKHAYFPTHYYLFELAES